MTPILSLQRLAALAVALVLVSAAACSSGAAGREAAEELAAAVEQTRAAGTARTALALRLAGGPEVTGEGVVDWAADQGRWHLTRGQRAPIEVRWHGDVAAYHIGEQWWRFERGSSYGFATPIAGDVGMSDPVVLLSAVEAAESVTAEEPRRDGGTTYAAQVPVSHVTVRALDESIDPSAMAELTVDTDAAGRVARIECVADARAYVPSTDLADPATEGDRLPDGDAETPGDSASPAADMTIIASLTLSDFGLDVDVAMPEDMASMDDFPSPHRSLGPPRPNR